MKTFIFLMCLVFCMTSFGADIPRVYLCRKCDISVIKAKRPNTLYCSAKGSHNWIDLGIVGENIYHCRKCRKIVYTAKRPNLIYCSAHGSHTWDLLGQVGKNQYQCRKCSIKISVRNRPSTIYCPAGGSHNWTDLYVHNQTNHIVFVNIVCLVECGRVKSENSGRARSATAKNRFHAGL